MSGTPLALLSLGVALRSATLLSATLEPVDKNEMIFVYYLESLLAMQEQYSCFGNIVVISPS